MGEQQSLEDEPGRLFLITSYAVLFIGGGMLGLFEAFLLPYSVSSAFAPAAPVSGPGGAAHVLAAGTGGSVGQLLSLGLLITVLANPALGVAGLWMAGTRLATLVPLLGWAVVVLSLGSVTSEGNNVLPGNLRSTAFLLLGVLGFLMVTVLARPTRGVTAVNGQSLLFGSSRPSAVPRSVNPTPGKSPAARTAPKGNRRR